MPTTFLVCRLLLGVAPQPGPAAWDTVAATLKSVPTVTAEYRRFAFPRADLAVTIGDVPVAAGMALGGWVGFVGGPGDAMVIGDLVVLASELPAVAGILTSRGIGMTAVHNHLARETPAVLYVHIIGTGRAVVLAEAIDAALGATATPRPAPVKPPQAPQLDTALVFSALGIRGRANGPIVNLSAQLVTGPIRVDGRDLPAPLAAASPINLQQVSLGRVVATGDFALPSARAPAVVTALERNGIAVTAIHSHYLASEPALVFVHFWADGPLPDVLRGLRAGIDAGK